MLPIFLIVTVQQLSSSSPSLITVEMLVKECHEDMQGFLYLQLLGSFGLVKDGDITPLDGMLQECFATANIFVSAFL